MERVLPVPGRLFWGLNLCVSNGTVSAGVCDGRDDFDFDIVGFPFLDGGVPRRASCGCACLNYDSPGLLRVLMTLAAVVEPLLPGFLGGAVVVLNFVGRFRNFVAGAVPCWGNMSSVWGYFCGGVCRNPNFTVTWCIDLEKL